jgi:type I site-specific restriction-modification system R (restriction) subunit
MHTRDHEGVQDLPVFGFTGSPIFAVNAAPGTPGTDHGAGVGDRLHTYTTGPIRDGTCSVRIATSTLFGPRTR